MKPKNIAPENARSATGQNARADRIQNNPEPQPSVEITLDGIDFEADTHSRSVHDDVATEYADLMKAGTVFPPVDVYAEGGAYFLADGFHRVVAAQKAGQRAIQARVQRGGRLDALKAALSANETHGLRRSIEDKRFAVDKALKEFADWSDRALAVLCHVSPTFAGERRKLQPPTDNVDSSPGTESPKRRGRDGKTRRQPKRTAAPMGKKGSAAAPSTASPERADSSNTAGDTANVVITDAEQMLSELAGKLEVEDQKVFWHRVASYAAKQVKAIKTSG